MYSVDNLTFNCDLQSWLEGDSFSKTFIKAFKSCNRSTSPGSTLGLSSPNSTPFKNKKRSKKSVKTYKSPKKKKNLWPNRSRTMPRPHRRRGRRGSHCSLPIGLTQCHMIASRCPTATTACPSTLGFHQLPASPISPSPIFLSLARYPSFVWSSQFFSFNNFDNVYDHSPPAKIIWDITFVYDFLSVSTNPRIIQVIYSPFCHFYMNL